MHDDFPVSPEQRRANAKWRAKLVAWKREYTALIVIIKRTKALYADSGSVRSSCVLLRALRQRADTMMCEREMIARNLRATSYRFVDLPEKETPDA